MIEKINKIKIDKDFWVWMEGTYDKNEEITSNDEISSKDKIKIQLKREDKIKVFTEVIVDELYFGKTYKIYISLGDFVPPDKSGFMVMEKGYAILYYDANFCLQDVVFKYNNMFLKRDSILRRK